MIDIHSHVVWGLDDGPENIEESLIILRDAAEAGTTDIVATPHLNSNFPYQAELLNARIRELSIKTGGNPRIHRGCDLHLGFDALNEVLQRPAEYSINGKQYLLVEFPDFSVGKHMEGVLQQLIDNGLIPIVTHPERNPVLQQDLNRVEEWIDLGCLVQITARSICGGFGRTAARVSRQLLDKKLVHVVASDAHDPKYRHARLDEAYEMVGSHCGKESADRLFTLNPEAIVNGRRVAIGVQADHPIAEQHWWQFWRAPGRDSERSL